MPFTTLGDVYQVRLKISKFINGNWVPSPSGEEGSHLIVAVSDADAVNKLQKVYGHDGVSINVRCHGGVQRVLQNVIIAV